MSPRKAAGLRSCKHGRNNPHGAGNRPGNQKEKSSSNMGSKIHDGKTPQERYAEKKLVPFQFRFNRDTDADILEHLKAVSNKQGYVKALIRADIARNKAGTTEQ